MRHFQTETDGRHLIVFTDHKPILGAFKAPHAQPYDPIAAQHIQEISMWTSDIRYITGKSNAVADWLSRPADVPIGAAYDLPTMMSVDGLAVDLVDHKLLARDQQTCQDIQAHKEGKMPKSVQVADVPFSAEVTLFCEVSRQKPRPVVPKPWREQIMRLFHQISHGGQKDTINKVSNAYYWPRMNQDISEYVKQCQNCQAVKSFKTVRPEQHSIHVPDQRFSSIQVDIVGPLPPSEGNRYLLTIWDRTSRWLEALPLIEANAHNCCLAFINGWIQRFGLPKIVTSDNGNTFVAQIWQGLHQHLGIKVEYTPPPYHRSSRGGGSSENIAILRLV